MSDPISPSSIIIIVSGGSASGKSTVCDQLAVWMNDQFGSDSTTACSILPLDAYYHCLSHLTPAERKLCNVDHPDAFDTKLLVDHLDQLRLGRETQIPQYDFATHTRLQMTKSLMPAQVIMVEGNLAIHWPELRARANGTIFISVDEHTRLSRRVNRDVCERGRTVECVNRQWIESVDPMHRQFCEPTVRYADLVVDGGRSLSLVVEEVKEFVVDKLKSSQSGCRCA